MIRPISFPDWPALTYGWLIPDAAKKNAGFHASEEPPFQYFNYLFKYLAEWEDYFDRYSLGIVNPGKVSGLEVLYLGAGVFTIGDGVYIDSLGRKITEDGTSTLTVNMVTYDNLTLVERVDGICIDLSDTSGTPKYIYVSDVLASPMSPTVVIAAPVISSFLGLNPYRLDRVLLGGSKLYISDGVTITDGAIFAAAIDRSIRSLNQNGGGVLPLIGQDFSKSNVSIRMRSGVILDGYGITKIHAGSVVSSGQVCPMVLFEGLKNHNGNISGNTLTVLSPYDFTDYGVGSLIYDRSSGINYYIATINQATAQICTIIKEDGSIPTLPIGVMNFDLKIVGAGLKNIELDGGGLPHAASSDSIVTFDETDRCFLENVVLRNSKYSVAHVKTGIYVDNDNKGLKLVNVKFPDPVSSIDYAILSTAGHLNEDWLISDFSTPENVAVGSSGSGIFRMNNNIFGVSVVLPAYAGWYGTAENKAHTVAGDHKPQVIGASNILDHSITALQIAHLTVTAAEIANATITNAKLGVACIATSNIQGNSVTYDKIYPRSSLRVGLVSSAIVIPGTGVPTVVPFDSHAAPAFAAIGAGLSDTMSLSDYYFESLRPGVLQYRISACVSFDSDAWAAGEYAALYVFKDGVMWSRLDIRDIEVTGTRKVVLKGSAIIQILPGEKIRIYVEQNGGLHALEENEEWTYMCVEEC